MTDVIDPVEPYESTEDPRNLPWHLERIAQRDYCGVNEGYWILRDAATALRKLTAAEAAGMVWVPVNERRFTVQEVIDALIGAGFTRVQSARPSLTGPTEDTQP